MSETVETKERVYGVWAGSKGKPEDKTRCIVAVWSKERWSRSYQCQKPRGFGPDGLYCKQHDPAAVEARDKARAAKYAAESAQQSQRWTDESVGRKLRERNPELYAELLRP